jgi:hypothetical protein
MHTLNITWTQHLPILAGWYLEAGMVGQIIELPNAIASEINIPQELKDRCVFRG